jgi:transposase-like protein
VSQDTFPEQEKHMSNDKQNDVNQRRQFSPEQKIKILREHLLDKVPISAVCEKHQITPTQFYQWQKTFFEHGAAAFAKATGPRATSQAEQRITKLEEKLQRKDEVIAEIMAEHILLKKELGES